MGTKKSTKAEKMIREFNMKVIIRQEHLIPTMMLIAFNYSDVHDYIKVLQTWIREK